MNNYIERFADINKRLEAKSLFLFGPRQTGKSSYIKHQLEPAKLSWTLLDNELYRDLSIRPSLLRNTLRAKGINDGVVVLDEIQRLPDLLNEVHMLIEETDIHFLLTGSSARKLKKKGVNLLGGRAGRLNFHPLVWPELRATGISLDSIFMTGLLPASFSSDDPETFLSDYVGLFEVPPFRKTRIRKPNASSKFYLFDVGVTRKLQGLSAIEEGTAEFGRYLENYIAMEIRSWLDYSGLDKEGLSYWHAQSGHEVDFIIKEKAAIEVKATKRVSARDLKGLKALKEEGLMERYILVCREDYPQLLDDGILILPYKDFLQQLWEGKIVS